MNTTNIETFEQFKDFVLERESYMKQLLEKVSEHENSYKSQIPKYCFSYTRKLVAIIPYINTSVIDNSEISNFRISFFKNYFSRFEDNLPDVKKKLLCKSKKKSDEVKPRSVYKKNSNFKYKINPDKSAICITSNLKPNSKEILIPDYIEGIPVTSIGKSAFEGSMVETIIFSKYINEIGERAFYNCNNLSFVELPDALEVIGELAFYSTSLTNIMFPAKIKEIGRAAFTFNIENGETDKPYLYNCGFLGNGVPFPGIKSDASKTKIYCFSGSACQDWAYDNGLSVNPIQNYINRYYRTYGNYLWRKRSEDCEIIIDLIERLLEAVDIGDKCAQLKSDIKKQDRIVALSRLVSMTSDTVKIQLKPHEQKYNNMVDDYYRLHEKIKRNINFIGTSYFKYAVRDSYDFRYVIYPNGVGICGYIGYNYTDLKIPDEIEGLPVIKIESGAFKCPSLKRIYLGSSLIEIDRWAFKRSKIETVVIRNNPNVSLLPFVTGVFHNSALKEIVYYGKKGFPCLSRDELPFIITEGAIHIKARSNISYSCVVYCDYDSEAHKWAEYLHLRTESLDFYEKYIELSASERLEM